MPRLAVVLLIATVAYNAAEGAMAILAGVQAGSVTLLTFGADSYLEVAAASAVLWRLSYTDEEAGERAEERALRMIGVTFLLLAAATVFQSTYALATGEGARESTLGLAVLLASVVLMPALAAEARETIACSYLTLTALVGVVAVALVGWWWLDAVAALAMVPWLVKEGMEGVRADACFDESERPCFCRPCFFGLRDCGPTCCAPACC